MNQRISILAASLCAMGFAFGATTTPVGYVSIECKANSDTIVGVPLRQSAAFAGTLSANPDTTTTPGSAILSLSGTPGLTANTFANTHYVKFSNTTPTAAAGDGQWFVITSNTTNSLTVDLNGGSIAAVSNAGLEVIKFWTLAELFNPLDSTTLASTTGNAIVESTNTFASGRRTEILLPNLTAQGINNAPNVIYYIHGDIWKKAASGNTNFGTTQLWPDTYFIIRNPSTVTASTFYTISGEVDMADFDIPLNVLASASQDNYIALNRPVNVKLRDLGLGGTSAFMNSENTFASGLRDQLLVYNYSATGINKAPIAIYYFHAGIWKKSASGNTDFGNDVIPAGSGFLIRKYQAGNNNTQYWSHTTPY